MKFVKRFEIVLVLLFTIGISMPVAVGLQGCAELRSAYKAAETPAELAYVLAEHYAGLVKAAADLAQKPTTPANVIASLQSADAKAKPVVAQLRPLRDAYLATKSAESEAELQAATDRAVLAIADLVRAVNSARGAK